MKLYKVFKLSQEIGGKSVESESEKMKSGNCLWLTIMH